MGVVQNRKIYNHAKEISKILLLIILQLVLNRPCVLEILCQFLGWERNTKGKLIKKYVKV